MSKLARLLLMLLLGGATGCSQLQSRPELALETAIPTGDNAPLDRSIMESEAKHPAMSAFSLLAEGNEAFAIRVQSARLARRSIDIQTYIWHADLTGMFFAHELVQAADRGVRVRLMIDDLDARARSSGFAALSAHPNISVRLFNPFASRDGAARFIGEGIRSFNRINRRMHNKSWIVDNRVAIVGGRNIGDEYFGAGDDRNFIDLEFAMFGPVVRDASASFDRYWNSSSSYPIELLDQRAIDEAELVKLRAALVAHSDAAAKGHYADSLRGDDAISLLISGHRPLEWSAEYRFVSDDPLKVTQEDSDSALSQVAAVLAPLSRSVKSDLTIISPYFVPGDSGSQLLIDQAQASRRIRILTNSLAANDVAAVHGGYSRYRTRLLEAGAQIWELKPLAQNNSTSSLFGSTGASLHTKALTFDSSILFVGSYNIDPRSTWLNCEQGVLVNSEVLAMQLEQIFTTQTDAANSWQVSLADGKLRWTDDKQSFGSDPYATWTRRFISWLTRVLHLEAQL